MNFYTLIASSPHYSRTYKPPSLQRFHQHQPNLFKSNIFPQLGRQKQSHIWEISEPKRKKFLTVNLKNGPAKISKKKGSIAGAVALIIGTSIGSGILALPHKTSPAGLVPSSITMTICWAFLLIEALLLVEINVGLQRKKKRKVDDEELEVMSIRTMAQETLGEWGGALATVTYVFLGYTSVIAYCSKSGEILHHLTDVPGPISGVFFTLFFTVLVSVGGNRATDQVNQWLTASMIGLLVSIEVLAVVFGGWSGFEGDGDWNKVPETLPIMIFALVYHDIAPVVCAYLEGDLARIRASVILGSVVPLITLLVWDAIALGLSNQADQVSDPVELLLRVNWGGVPFMVEAFSLLAVGTSLIGTLIGFSEFFKEQLNNMSSDFSSAQLLEKSNLLNLINRWWEKNKTSITATAMVIAPSLVVSTTIPDAFSAATDFAEERKKERSSVKKKMWLLNSKGKGKGNGKFGERNGLVAVGIDRDKGSQHAIKWASQNLITKGQTLILIHVVHNSTSPPLSNNYAIYDLNGPTNEHKRGLEKHTKELFLPYHCFCYRKHITWFDVVLEDTDIAKAITDYVAHAAIETLVLGASHYGFIKSKMVDDVPIGT